MAAGKRGGLKIEETENMNQSECVCEGLMMMMVVVEEWSGRRVSSQQQKEQMKI